MAANLNPVSKTMEKAVVVKLDEKSPIGIRTFTCSILEQVIHFHIVLMNKTAYVWVGVSGDVINMSVAMPTRFESVPTGTELLGSSLGTTATNMAKRLAKKTGQQVFVSCDIPNQDTDRMTPLIEKRILKEILPETTPSS
eukprot:m.31768 g.31768  ORF g.31768 m.31768 type:complete len:140 (+) comp16514_c0_seq1:28-447(+)